MTHLICTMLLSFAMNGPAVAAPTNPLAVLQNPVASPQEIAAFKKYKNDPKASRQFIATRKYMRALKDSPKPPPMVPEDVQLDFTLDFDEQLALFNAMLYWGIAGGSMA